MRACNDLGYAAAVLRDRGYGVFLRDYQTARLTREDLFADLARERPHVLCLSTTNATVFEDLELMGAVRDEYPDMRLVLKGAIFYDPDAALLDMLDLSAIDVLIGGEIDFAIGEVADALLKGGDLEVVPNIIHRDRDGRWRPTRFHVWQDDLDSVPFPARELMDNALYVRPDVGRPMATIQTSRGCPSSCIYCLSPEISGRRVRQRSVESVFEEIRECHERHGIRDFFFKADTFTIDNAWVEALCERIIDSDLAGKIEFTANSRVRPLTRRVLERMREAGCFAVAFGFESGSDDTLRRIRKGATVAENRQAMAWAREVGLQVYGFFMIGFPWEGPDDIELTRRHIFELDPDFIEVHVALPYYGTELYELCREEGVLERGVLGSDYFHSSTTGTVSVPMEELVRLRAEILRTFYLRPSYVARRLAQGIRDPRVLANYARYGLRMLRNLRRSDAGGGE